ncbi:MAG: ABC transporter ATP-binding protein [Calditrichaceae bacterium]|nr:ABC transporter ATP-binding protein [Calditrichaceae bacterium]
MKRESPIISIKNLSKIFNKGRHNQVDAVVNVTFSIQSNQCIVIKGPSGSGKSTLLSILGCLAKPTQGEYICLDQKVSRWSEKFLTQFRREYIGIVFQNFNLITGLSVKENASLPLLPMNLSAKTIEDKSERILRRLQIDHRLSFKADTLSGGEMQRLAIARALINNPDILIADEPTAHLDTELAKDILEIFYQLKADGKTLIIASHDPLVENHQMVDEVFCMRDGRLGELDVC